MGGDEGRCWFAVEGVLEGRERADFAKEVLGFEVCVFGTEEADCPSESFDLEPNDIRLPGPLQRKMKSRVPVREDTMSPSFLRSRRSQVPRVVDQ